MTFAHQAPEGQLANLITSKYAIPAVVFIQYAAQLAYPSEKNAKIRRALLGGYFAAAVAMAYTSGCADPRGLSTAAPGIARTRAKGRVVENGERRRRDRTDDGTERTWRVDDSETEPRGNRSLCRVFGPSGRRSRRPRDWRGPRRSHRKGTDVVRAVFPKPHNTLRWGGYAAPTLPILLISAATVGNFVAVVDDGRVLAVLVVPLRAQTKFGSYQRRGPSAGQKSLRRRSRSENQPRWRRSP